MRPRPGSRGRRAGVDEALGDWIDTKVQSLECARAEEGEVARLAEHHFVAGLDAHRADDGEARYSLEHRAVRLTKVPDLLPLDAETLEHLGGNPRELGAGVDEDTVKNLARSRTREILDLDIDAKGAHVLGHDSLLYLAELYRKAASSVKRRNH